jgi:hypothetical protein
LSPSPDRVASPPETRFAETAEFWPFITIQANARGDFGGQEVVSLNNIGQLAGTEPNFLKIFRDKLKRRRWIASFSVCFSFITCRSKYSPLSQNPGVPDLKREISMFDNYFEHAPTDATQTDRISTKHELHHLAGAFLRDGWKDCTILKEDNFRWIFDELGSFLRSILPSREKHGLYVLVFYSLLWKGHVRCSRVEWPLKLVVNVESEQKRYHYTPRSDFLLSVDQLVYLMVEVQSDRNESDRHRMLLQAACAVRLGNSLRCGKGDPFIVMALYISNSGSVTRYLLLQNGDVDSKVCAWTSVHTMSCFSVVHLGLLCLRNPRLDTVARAVYHHV